MIPTNCRFFTFGLHQCFFENRANVCLDLNLIYGYAFSLMKRYHHCPLGWLEISVSDKALRHIRFLETKPESHPQVNNNKIIRQVIRELTEYFMNDRTDFTLPLEPSGTDFQQSVWKKLREIPYGQTTSYGKLAKQLGDPGRVRAIGRANGQNPIPIVIPCHRVIGKNGNLIGYGGGIDRKQFLLQHEGALLL